VKKKKFKFKSKRLYTSTLLKLRSEKKLYSCCMCTPPSPFCSFWCQHAVKRLFLFNKRSWEVKKNYIVAVRVLPPPSPFCSFWCQHAVKRLFLFFFFFFFFFNFFLFFFGPGGNQARRAYSCTCTPPPPPLFFCSFWCQHAVMRLQQLYIM
jgi:hypothetical protein